MVEVNVSCPMPKEGVGMHIGRDPQLTAEQTRAVKEAIDLPVSVKLSPNFAYLDEIARAAEQAGADAISATNSVQALYGIDIESGKPWLPAFGGYSGPAIKPITLRCVAKIARAVTIPISGIGGISSWRDVVEYIMVGATTVQTCTAVMWNGLTIFNEWIEGLKSFMDRKGYDSIEDFRGIALPYLTSVEELATHAPATAAVDGDLCTGCKMCIQVCQYDAITLSTDKVRVDDAKCDGCGLCIAWCPVSAITLM
jgi:dihydropyrimidine dehydrogenase (NAD+) subunit PreA